jgi:hypothetical protein
MPHHDRKRTFPRSPNADIRTPTLPRPPAPETDCSACVAAPSDGKYSVTRIVAGRESSDRQSAYRFQLLRWVRDPDRLSYSGRAAPNADPLPDPEPPPGAQRLTRLILHLGIVQTNCAPVR